MEKHRYLMDAQSLADFDVVMLLCYGGAAVSWEVVLKINGEMRVEHARLWTVDSW